VLAKKEINAEIKEHAGSSDQILPSDLSGVTIHDGRSIPDNKLGSDRLKSEFAYEQAKDSASNQSFGESIMAKVTSAAIAVKETLQNIVPSETLHSEQSNFEKRELQGEKLAGLSGTNDALIQDNILAKKEVNAEIKEHAGSDHILPSELKAEFHKDQLQNKAQGDRLSDLGAIDKGALKDEVMKDHVLAKKEINAEIKEHAGSSDQILPSDLSGVTIHDGRSIPDASEEPHQSFGEMVKAKVTNAANAVKETLQNFH